MLQKVNIDIPNADFDNDENYLIDTSEYNLPTLIDWGKRSTSKCME